jgi:tryptophan synthase beta chain
LDYPGVGAEHSFLKDAGRAEYIAVSDEDALEALQQVSRKEGLIPAFETAHAFAPLWNPEIVPPGTRVLVNMSGRGDKDMGTAAKILKL